jgi:hypothetical protein
VVTSHHRSPVYSKTLYNVAIIYIYSIVQILQKSGDQVVTGDRIENKGFFR